MSVEKQTRVDVNLPQDPFRMLTRQLHGPDLDCIIPESTFFFRLQVHHLSLGLLVCEAWCLGVHTGRHLCKESNTVTCGLKKSDEGMLKEVENFVEVTTK